MVIFIGSLVGILMLKTLDLLIRLHLFGDYYAWSAANDVKRVQTGYIKNFRYLMTMVYEILLLVDEDMIVEVEKTKRSNGFDRIVKSPSRQNVSKASATKNYQISPRLPLFQGPKLRLPGRQCDQKFSSGDQNFIVGRQLATS